MAGRASCFAQSARFVGRHLPMYAVLFSSPKIDLAIAGDTFTAASVPHHRCRLI